MGLANICEGFYLFIPLFLMKLRILFFIFTINNLYGSETQSTPEVPPKCVPEYQSKGVYVCRFQTQQNIDNIECNIVDGTTCAAVFYDHVKTIPSKPYTHFKVTIEQSKYQKSALTIVIKDSGTTKKILETVQIQYFYPLDVETRIDCIPKISDSPYASKYQCTVHISQESFVLSKLTNTDCVVDIPTVASATSEPPYLFTKTYNVEVRDSEKICKKTCKVKVSIPDTDSNNQQISKELSHTTFCQVPTIYCDNHDTDTRIIVCMIYVTYPLHHIKLTSLKADSVELDRTAISSAMLTVTDAVSPVRISYKLKNIKQNDKKFKINFKIFQNENEQNPPGFVHEQEIEFEYILSDREKPYLSCKISPNQPEDFEATKYICDMLSTDENINLSIEPTSGYELTPTSSNGNNFHEMKIHQNKELTIKYTSKICNDYNNMKIKFTDNGNVISTFVPHLTTCPEPVVKCVKHDHLTRKITCNFNKKYPIEQVGLTSSKSYVTLNPTTIAKSEFNAGILNGKFIDYVIEDFSKSDKTFEVEFSFKQSNDKVAHRVKYNFNYILKKEETPHLTCVIKSDQSGIAFQSKKYTCDVYASTSSVTLIVTPTKDFIIAYSTLTLQKNKELYSQTEIDVTITPNTVTCKSSKEIKIEFTDSKGTYRYSDIHITTCPEPKINFKAHQTFTRKITCEFQFNYDVSKILISSTKSHVQLLKNSIEVNVDKGSVLSTDIEYAIDDYSVKDLSFEILFQVMQSETLESYRFKKSFLYVLKEDEKPHISCRKADEVTSKKKHFSENIFSCTIVSRGAKISLKTEPNKYTAEPQEIQGNEYKNLKRRVQDITLKPNPVLCGESKNVEISFEDDSNAHDSSAGTTVSHSYTVNHETICPDPIINCDKHDHANRNIECNIQIDFEYKDVKLAIKPADTGVTVKDKLEKSEIGNGANKVTISYQVDNWSKDNHRFKIEFKVVHAGNQEAYKTERGFSYILKENENPYIKCQEKLEKESYFADAAYTCSLLSKQSDVEVKTEPTSYQIQTPKPKIENSNSVHKIMDKKYVIRATQIICNKIQIVKLYFTEGTTEFSDKVTQTIICPAPTFEYGSQTADGRTIPLTIKAEYSFISATIESNSNLVVLTYSPISACQKEDLKEEYKATTQITYEPADLSKDEIEFLMIVKLTLPLKSMTQAQTQVYKVTLKEEELPHLKCGGQMEPHGDHFTISSYKCNILSRNPTFTLKLKTENYALHEIAGEREDFKSVFRWTDFKITIRDDAIQCDQKVSLEISFTDKDREVEASPQVTITTSCPEPKVTCDDHNEQTRIIVCQVSTEFPYTSVEIFKVDGSVTVSSPHSEIVHGNKLWSSKHIVSYTPTSLTPSTFDFTMSLKLIQSSTYEKTSQLPFTFKLLKTEIPQITCQEIETLDLPVANSKYQCYMVTTQHVKPITFTINDTNFDKTSNLNSHSPLINLHKWENVEITLTDKLILCNRTINILLTATDDSHRYTTVLRHTTKCKDILGNCTLLKETKSNVICHFQSEQAFKFVSHLCSEPVDCSKPEDLATIKEKEIEIIIDFELHSISELVEFDLNVTLAYSEHSHVSFQYELSSSISHVPATKSAAQVNDSFLGMSLIFGVGVVIFIIIARKKLF